MTTPIYPLPVPVMKTSSIDDIMPAAFMNSQLRDGVNFVANPPVLYCYASTSQSVLTNTWTALTLDSNVYDTYNGHSTTQSQSEYVATVAGLYLVIARSGWVNNTTGVRGAAITTNGAAVSGTTPQLVSQTSATSTPWVQVTGIVQLAVGGYVQTWGFQNSGGTLSTNANPGTSTAGPSMQVRWLHA